MIEQQKFDINHDLFPFVSQTIQLSTGANIHYIDEGAGPILLFLHGNPTWSFLYRNIIQGLTKQFRCIALDFPGFGLSTAPANFSFSAAEQADILVDFVETLKLDDYTIMMQDWGGPTGFWLAEQAPEKVRGLIIGNTWAWPLERFGQKMFSRLMGGMIGRTLSWCCNGVVGFFMTKGVVHRLKPEVMKMYKAPFHKRRNRRQTHIFPRQLMAAAPFLSKIFLGLPSLKEKPTLILWGEKDFAFQKPERERFESLFPNHHTVLLAEAGHFIQEDAPEKIILAIQQWSLFKQ